MKVGEGGGERRERVKEGEREGQRDRERGMEGLNIMYLLTII